jgi:hypothetical protein
MNMQMCEGSHWLIPDMLIKQITKLLKKGFASGEVKEVLKT